MVLISAFVMAACLMLVENDDTTFFLIKNWMPEELNSYYREPLEIHTMCVREGHLFPESCSNTKGKNVYLYVFWKCLEKIRFTFYWIWYRKIDYLYLSLRLTLFSGGLVGIFRKSLHRFFHILRIRQSEMHSCFTTHNGQITGSQNHLV